MPRSQNESPHPRVNAHAGDMPFRHYSLRHRLVAFVSKRVFDRFVYTVRHGLLRGMKRKGGLGWIPEIVAGRESTRELEFYRNRSFSGQVVYDIGAYHGLMTLFFARTARHVVSYEPTTINSMRLRENLELNEIGNVTVRQLALGDDAGSAQIVFDPLMSGGASLDSSIGAGVVSGSDARTESIKITTLDQDIQENRLPTPDFVKIDVEGFELSVLKGARRTLASSRPALFIELHGETLNEKARNVASVISFLESVGYPRIVHVETGSLITSNNSEAAAQGHLYCTA